MVVITSEVYLLYTPYSVRGLRNDPIMYSVDYGSFMV